MKLFKYHGLGNDFVVLDARNLGARDLTPLEAVAYCDRRRGIGGDGVLVLLPSAEAFARMVVHNPDGSIAEMCGNGLRCAVKYLADRAGNMPAVMDVATGAGVLRCEIHYGPRGAEAVTIEMGRAHLVADNLPSGALKRPFVSEQVPGYDFRGTAVSMGNPHLVLFDRPLEEAGRLGPKLELHPSFTARTNVEFTSLRDGGLDVVVWERGAGLTQACGTGACAAVAAYVLEGRLPGNTWVEARLPGGPLQIRVEQDLSRVQMRGPVAFVFEAVVPDLPAR